MPRAQHRNRLLAVLCAIVIGAVGAVTAAGPASAADEYRFLRVVSNNLCVQAQSLNWHVITNTCTQQYRHVWEYQPRGFSGSGRPLVKFQSALNNGCLDSRDGVAGSAVYNIACNTGAYQLWEVFKVGPYEVYKSWGAFVHRNVHVCLQAGQYSGNTLGMQACNTASTRQQWILP